jgi:hypothetical protein
MKTTDCNRDAMAGFAPVILLGAGDPPRTIHTAKSDGSDPWHECDNIYIGDGICVCWRCGKETPLAST